MSFPPQAPPGVSALWRMSPVALACTWALHMLSAQKPLDGRAPRRTSWSKDVVGMFCWTIQLALWLILAWWTEGAPSIPYLVDI